MPNINMPQSVSQFFAAKGADVDEALSGFREDAVVWDSGEDKELRGVDAIREWLMASNVGYKLTTEVVSAEANENELLAGVVVTGDFPGSPYKFEYRFTLVENQINELKIDPIGSLAE
ncbi:MAG TPA: nuclear transport factor 2 family protein [Armatimonadetes bacterium]|nr:nuclear transport factor 2 family protein [Armatimonadota bacterium]